MNYVYKKLKYFDRFFSSLVVETWLVGWDITVIHLGFLCLKLDCLVAGPKQEEVLPHWDQFVSFLHCSFGNKG